jgi:dTDP-4-amino-4,6-dideoxygalactose transaminase
MSKIAIMRPKLPSADRLAPYLKKIDSSRIYSNFGPLALAFEERLAAGLGVSEGMVCTVANATQGLALALAAQDVRPGTLCVMPAWTFIASAHAATMAGLVPYFVDVDLETWALDPDRTSDAIARAPSAVGAVMPVVPFGQPIDVKAWDQFRAKTGVPVVIDAAAGFDSLVASETPAVVSLHATKVLGVGEGGFVMSTDRAMVKSIRTRANFGFFASRESRVTATNAKLSEFHAAVGHASLDEWTTTRAEWIAVAAAYRRVLPESNRIRYQRGFGANWVASTCIVRLPDFEAAEAEQALADAGVETRRWWGEGAHAHAATVTFPRSALPTTQTLARSTLSLPFYRDLEPAQIEHVSEAVLAVTPR